MTKVPTHTQKKNMADSRTVVSPGKREAPSDDEEGTEQPTNPAPKKRQRSARKAAVARNFAEEVLDLREAQQIATEEFTRCEKDFSQKSLSNLRHKYGVSAKKGALGWSVGSNRIKEINADARHALTKARSEMNKTTTKLKRVYAAWSRAVVKMMTDEKLVPAIQHELWDPAPNEVSAHLYPLELSPNCPSHMCVVQSEGLSEGQYEVRYFIADPCEFTDTPSSSSADDSDVKDKSAVLIYRQFSIPKNTRQDMLSRWCMPFVVAGLTIPRSWYIWVSRGVREETQRVLYGEESVFKYLNPDIKNVIECMVRDSC